MFGIKIMTSASYEAEKKATQMLKEAFDKVAREKANLEIDIKDLREQNTKLRSINAKRKDENLTLSDKNTKYKQIIKEHDAFRRAIKSAFKDVDFRGYTPVPCDKKCSECTIEQAECKKYTNLSVCMMKIEPSFRESDNNQ